MASTLVAWCEARDTAVPTLKEIAAVYDEHITTIGNDVIVPALNRLIGHIFIHSSGTASGGFTGGRIQSPLLRRHWPLDVPTGFNGENTRQKVPIDLYPESPLPLDVSEALSVLMTNAEMTGGVGLVGCWLSDTPISPIKGEIRTIKGATSFTPVAKEWRSGAITLEQDLPVGRYNLVGAKIVGGNTIGLFRFIIMGYSWRPGGLIHKYIQDADIHYFRKGGLGVWGTFSHDQIPHLEVLEINAIANPTVYLDLIKVA